MMAQLRLKSPLNLMTENLLRLRLQRLKVTLSPDMAYLGYSIAAPRAGTYMLTPPDGHS